MRMISEAALAALKARYPAGTRVELIHMDDPYNKKLVLHHFNWLSIVP